MSVLRLILSTKYTEETLCKLQRMCYVVSYQKLPKCSQPESNCLNQLFVSHWHVQCAHILCAILFPGVPQISLRSLKKHIYYSSIFAHNRPTNQHLQHTIKALNANHLSCIFLLLSSNHPLALHGPLTVLYSLKHNVHCQSLARFPFCGFRDLELYATYFSSFRSKLKAHLL